MFVRYKNVCKQKLLLLKDWKTQLEHYFRCEKQVNILLSSLWRKGKDANAIIFKMFADIIKFQS